MSGAISQLVFFVKNQTQFLDTSKGRLINGSFSDLINENQFRFEKDGSITLPPNFYVRDALGWANIHKLQILFASKMELNPILLKTESNKQILVNDSILIPIYNNNIIRGFHGEVKYAHDLKRINEIKSGFEKVMVFDYNSDKVCRLENLYIEKVNKQLFIDDFWISIKTKTQFINLNGIQLYV